MDMEKAASIYKMTCDQYNYARSCAKFGDFKVIGEFVERSTRCFSRRLQLVVISVVDVASVYHKRELQNMDYSKGDIYSSILYLKSS